MNELAIVQSYIPAMNELAIEKVRKLESFASRMQQIDIPTSHVLHAGMYSRTVMIPAGAMITGALIKIATILVVQGDVIVYIGDEAIELYGYNVLPASANRKQAFVAQTDAYLTMIFPSKAKTLAEAEDEFTDDADMLISRKDATMNQLIITGQ